MPISARDREARFEQLHKLTQATARAANQHAGALEEVYGTARRAIAVGLALRNVLVDLAVRIEAARQHSWIARWLLRRVPPLTLAVEDFNRALDEALRDMDAVGEDLDRALRARAIALGPPVPAAPKRIPFATVSDAEMQPPAVEAAAPEPSAHAAEA